MIAPLTKSYVVLFCFSFLIYSNLFAQNHERQDLYQNYVDCISVLDESEINTKEYMDAKNGLTRILPELANAVDYYSQRSQVQQAALYSKCIVDLHNHKAFSKTRLDKDDHYPSYLLMASYGASLDNDYQSVIPYLKEYVKVCPPNLKEEGYMHLISAYERIEEFPEVIEVAEEAIAEYPNNIDFVRSELNACYESKAYGRLLDCLKQLQKSEFNNNRVIVDKYAIPYSANKVKIGSNLQYAFSAKSRQLRIWSIETHKERKVLDFESKINSFDLSFDNSMLAIALESGDLYVYDTREFKMLNSFHNLGLATECKFHRDGKYIVIQIGGKQLALLNLKDENNIRTISSSEPISRIHEYHDLLKGGVVLACSTTTGGAVVLYLPSMQKNRQAQVEDLLNKRLSEWSQRQPGETNEQYMVRVSEESRRLQARLIENEIVTALAGTLLDDSEISFGSYSSDQNLLSVNFNTMPTIYLEVLPEDLSSFSSADDLAFSNTIYGLTENDNFEVIYTEVFNRVNGKSYVYDNTSKRTLDYMSVKDSFVPIEVIQMTSADQTKLEELRDDVMLTAKSEKLVSDHMDISVKSTVLSDYNDSGERVYNYAIKYSYDVDMRYSAEDDFGPGKYDTNESQAAMTMLSVIKKAFEGDFAQYVKSGKSLLISISGMADATPIVNRHIYNGKYGSIENELVSSRGSLVVMNIPVGSQIVRNEELAFLRALGVRQYIADNIANLSDMNVSYQTKIEVSKGAGSQYRRIEVEFIFIDAFDR